MVVVVVFVLVAVTRRQRAPSPRSSPPGPPPPTTPCAGASAAASLLRRGTQRLPCGVEARNDFSESLVAVQGPAIGVVDRALALAVVARALVVVTCGGQGFLDAVRRLWHFIAAHLPRARRPRACGRWS